MPIRPATRLLLLASLLLCAACSPPPLPFARLAGLVASGELDEISGLAVSRQHQDVLWAVNDGGNAARLYALSTRGTVLARFEVKGAKNIDWEDLASFELGGKRYLLIADIGDNGGKRKDFLLHVFEEPAVLKNGSLKPAWIIRARWPDGPRDCEAIAVDPVAGQVLLISKKRSPPDLFALTLADPGGRVREARRIGRLDGVPKAGIELQRYDRRLARMFAYVTSADLSPDRQTLAVLTYGSVLFYRRKVDETWADAVARTPETHDIPLIPQAEALTWSAGGNGLYATGEFNPAPLFYLVPQG